MTTASASRALGEYVAGGVSVRFEDLTQDGRLTLEAIPNALAPIAWRYLLAQDPFGHHFRKLGILAILTRFVIAAGAGPFAASAKFEAQTRYGLALTQDEKLVLDMWGELQGPLGLTYGTPPRKGEQSLAGTLWAEHTFTRPFAPPGQRRVRRQELESIPELRAFLEAKGVLGGGGSLALDQHRPRPEDVAAIPAGAVALEPAARPDPVAFAFGIMHTDSNAHVNSLVYLRMLEEAALRRFVEIGRGEPLLARTLDIAYRKPFFAAQQVRVVQQAFLHDGRLGVAAAVVPHSAGASDAALVQMRPHTFARITFEP